MGENFDEFDELKQHCQSFPYQYFAIKMLLVKPLYL